MTDIVPSYPVLKPLQRITVTSSFLTDRSFRLPVRQPILAEYNLVVFLFRVHDPDQKAPKGKKTSSDDSLSCDVVEIIFGFDRCWVTNQEHQQILWKMEGRVFLFLSEYIFAWTRMFVKQIDSTGECYSIEEALTHPSIKVRERGTILLNKERKQLKALQNKPCDQIMKPDEINKNNQF